MASKLVPFTESDWAGFAGAMRWPAGTVGTTHPDTTEPLICYVEDKNTPSDPEEFGHGVAVIVDVQGVAIEGMEWGFFMPMPEHARRASIAVAEAYIAAIEDASTKATADVMAAAFGFQVTR